MKKHAPKLFFLAAILLYLAAFFHAKSRSAYTVLGSLFLVLGMVNNNRSKHNQG